MVMFKSVVKDYNGIRPWTLHFTDWCEHSAGTVHTLENLQKIDFGKTKNARILAAKPGTKIELPAIWSGGKLLLIRMTDEEIANHDRVTSLEQQLSDVRAKIYAAIPQELKDLQKDLEKQLREIKKEKK